LPAARHRKGPPAIATPQAPPQDTSRQSPHGLWLSSLGIGTYLGRDDAKTDALYTASVRRALQTDAQRALQFARSAPGITCALVGMKTPAHVEENAALARVDPLSIRNQT
jgi:aryl-alcohol dehydrogenase-like predicted oxidoreductase